MSTDIEKLISHLSELKNRDREREYVTAGDVCARYSITQMTLWRWLNKPDVNFPKPMVISKRRYFRFADLIAWESAREARH